MRTASSTCHAQLKGKRPDLRRATESRSVDYSWLDALVFNDETTLLANELPVNEKFVDSFEGNRRSG